MSYPTPQILYQDSNLLVINKPAGLLVHAVRPRIANYPMPTPAYRQIGSRPELPITPTLVDWLLKKFPEIKNVRDQSINEQAMPARPGIVHRLDKDTSGVLVVAKNQRTFDYLKKLFQTRQIKKTYLALVHGQIKDREGLIDKPLGIRNGTVKRTTRIDGARFIRPAITAYQLVCYYGHPSESGLRQSLPTGRQALPSRRQSATFSLLKVTPQTGRTHQIRVHLASIGHPIVGDQLYGRKNDKQLLGRQFLHAESVEFTTPEGGRLKISADLPTDLQRFLDEL